MSSPSARRLSLRLRLLAALAAVGLLVAACGSDDQNEVAGSPAQSSTEQPGSTELLSGTTTTVGGGTVDLADYAGQDVILWFWAPW